MSEPAATSTGPLRILHLNSMLTGGGTDEQCLMLATGLRQLGHMVWLGGPDDNNYATAARSQSVSFVRLPPTAPMHLRFIFSAARLIRREKIQIVHGHHGRDYWATALAAKLSRAKPKIIFTRHMAKSPGSKFSRDHLLGYCDAMIAVSEFTARVLRDGVYEPDSREQERHARPPMRGDLSKIHLIHGGIDTTRFRPFDAAARRREWGLAPEHFAFAMAGGYDLPRGKGQREFLEAAATIHATIPNARFLIIGRGNMADLLRDDIARLGLKDKAWLTPFSSDMPEAMNAIDCLVHGQVGTEAFGLVLLEAFACGRPVIASALDGIPEAFATGGLGQLVKPGSVPELASAMRAWAARPPPSAARRDELHAKIENEFSVPAFAHRMMKCYAKIPSRS